jgi:two-component system sensor histidine kinase PfeS
MRLPDRHSLLWKLIIVLALLCLLLVSLNVNLSKRVNDATARLSEPARRVLGHYALGAEQAFSERGAAGVDRFLQQLREHEKVWAVVVDGRNQSLASTPIAAEDQRRLHFTRTLDGPVGRPGGWPTYYMPFSQTDGRLVMELPRRFNPRQHQGLWEILLQRIIPALLALLIGILLYRMLIAPMVILRRQANALGTGDLTARVGPQLADRRDELGELSRALNHMAGRLESTVVFQRQLLRALSHELRTPLSRLRVSGERELDIDALRQRQEREIQVMERLINDTLELVWLDNERPSLPLETVEIAALWDMLRDDACFETGWDTARLPCDVPADCCVLGNLNGLAQVFENVLRNAVRHSPEGGLVRLSGRREGAFWHLWIEDQGPGVAPEKLAQIFQPFTRLNAARPGGDGFGLGLSIARSVVQVLGGEIWAENAGPGLRVNLKLPSV